MISDNQIGNRGGRALANALRINCTVVDIDLGGNRVNARVLRSIEEVLQTRIA